MSADRPDRPGVAALAEELAVRRRVRFAITVGAAVALTVFVLFAYLPGTDESLLYWAALTFVLGAAVAGLLATLSVGYAAYRRTLDVNDLEPGRPAPTTLAVVLGALGGVFVPVTATLAFDRMTAGFELLLATVTGGFVVLVVGGLGVRLVGALSLDHEWRPRYAAAGGTVYTALVVIPAVGCAARGPCLGTPDALVAALLEPSLAPVAPEYALASVGGGVLLGAAFGLRRVSPAHGFFAGCVATVGSLPVVAATAGDPETVRLAALYLPAILGIVAALGSAAVLAALGEADEDTSTGGERRPRSRER